MSDNWEPVYTITPEIAQALMHIEAARAVVAQINLPPAAEARLREQARLRSTHFSTYIEGNRLTLAETQQVVSGRKVHFFGRARDVMEVRNYWRALARLDEWIGQQQSLAEELIRRLHGLVEYGPRAKPTLYRDGQNAIRDAQTGALVYLPPEARDVPELMAGFIRWYNLAVTAGLPVPLIAGLAHYQLVTIHPFYDGNGRTARLLATFLLHHGGYGLYGFFSLEEYHARDLDAYYQALAAHPDYNYYGGRAQADLTSWLTYFTELVARVFTLAQDEALTIARQGLPAEPEALRRLDRRARTVFALFTRQNTITATDVAAILGLSDRSARDLLATWVAQGWLEMTSAARRNRAYRLSAEYRHFIGKITAG